MSNLIKTSLFLSLLLGTLQSIQAKDHVLATITNDDDNNIYKIGLQTDDATESVVKIYKKELSAKGKLLDHVEFTPSEMEKGVTIVKRSGYDVVALRAENVNVNYGGDITMTTLVHALKKTKKDYDLKVEKEGRDWKLLFENNEAKKLHFTTNKKFLIGSVGIKDVQAKK
ncbi:hypothetical protein [Bacteriovorax sp. DB6_IX]|uniref:hypothetical protein n=1 Tax=Bacteriovorax sp. DB6_IX TaxID=1353530 RepID=UPI00038A03C5|nr:hypothetical protein [Bacteriovorax sp. DB6_IX]EQC47883.1 hypothetical protein M901_2768 [Bacteriovorax sp. DB6_IX]